jgi:hypothetical protein
LIGCYGKADRSGRKLQLSPKRRPSLKLQEQYMGYVRGLKPKQKAEVKRLFGKMGIQAAISRAESLIGKKAA